MLDEHSNEVDMVRLSKWKPYEMLRNGLGYVQISMVIQCDYKNFTTETRLPRPPRPPPAGVASLRGLLTQLCRSRSRSFNSISARVLWHNALCIVWICEWAVLIEHKWSDSTFFRVSFGFGIVEMCTVRRVSPEPSSTACTFSQRSYCSCL